MRYSFVAVLAAAGTAFAAEHPQGYVVSQIGMHPRTLFIYQMLTSLDR